MDNKESIFEYIEKNIQRNGTLSEKFDLSKYKHLQPNELNFADGMIDYCFPIAEDYEAMNLLIDIMKQLKDTKETMINNISVIDNYYNKNPDKHILGSVNEFLRVIMQDCQRENKQYDEQLIYQWALYMMLFAKEIETVKIGIAIIGLFSIGKNEKIVQLLEKLSLCEEFTKYTSVALKDVPNANEIKFRLAKKVSGYGKVILVEDIEVENEEIKEWLLCDGCASDADNVWLVSSIIQKINLPQMIRERTLSEDEVRGLYNIVEAMTEDRTQNGITIYKQKSDLFMEITKQYEHCKNNIIYLQLLAIIKSYCEIEKFNCDALPIIQEKMNSEEIKNFIKTAINEKNEIERYVFVASYINNLDIYDNVFEAFKRNTEQNMYCLDYLFENTKNIEDLLKFLKNVIDLNENKGNPKPIIDFGGSTSLITVIRNLEKYPFYGEEFVIAGLKNKTMHPRNAALETIMNWKKVTNKKIQEMPENIKNTMLELREKEVIKSYKEMINEILEIEEDLSNYKEPEVIYGLKESTGIHLQKGDIESLFSEPIIYRGKDYFESNMIHHCELTNSNYIAYVQGTDFSTEYKVVIAVNEENEIINMKCNCPYQNNCKHEYATLLYIRNQYKNERGKEND